MRRWLAALLLFFLLGACAQAPTLQQREAFTPRPERDVLYVVPFTRVMVPWDINEQVFDLFVDALNESALPSNYQFAILKTPLSAIDPDWLSRQYYVSGEIFGYRQDSGCCSTLLQLTGRAYYHQPEQQDPTLQLEYPAEIFFDHDASTLEQERRKLAQEVASQLAAQFLDAFLSP